MSILGTLGVIGAGIGAAGSIASSQTQAGAAESAQQLQAQEAQQSLQFQEQEFNTQQKNAAPFVQAGQGAITSLSQLLSKPGEGLLTPWTQQFEAPTAAQAEATPGYQFTAQQGEEALQNSAAASGGLLTGGTAKALTNYGENLAATNYQQTYQNALTQYQQAYNIFQNNQSNTYNRLAGVSGAGQQAVATLGNQGQAAANNVSSINLTTGAQQGQDIQNAGAATASGYAGVTNSLTGGLGALSGQLTLQQLMNGGGNYVPGSVPGY